MIFHELSHRLFQVGCDTSLTDSLRVKALSCVAFLIKQKSKVTPGPSPDMNKQSHPFPGIP